MRRNGGSRRRGFLAHRRARCLYFISAWNASRVLSEWLRELMKLKTRGLCFIAIGIGEKHPQKPPGESARRSSQQDPGACRRRRRFRPDNTSSNAADCYGVFQLRAMQRIIELIPAPSPGVPQD